MAGIREARPGEEGAVVALYQWLFDPPGSVPPVWDEAAAESRLREAIDADTAVVFLAEDDEGLCGLCTAYIDIHSVRFGRRCWVEDLAVHPGRRSAGSGKALLDAAKAWAREHGAANLKLSSGNARADAHRFYEREGSPGQARIFEWDV